MAGSCVCSDRILTASLSGEIDHHGAREIMEMLDSRIDSEMPRRLRMDLSSVTFMDSSGIAVLLRAHKRMAALDGRVEVINIPQQAERVLRAAGLQRIMRFI